MVNKPRKTKSSGIAEWTKVIDGMGERLMSGREADDKNMLVLLDKVYNSIPIFELNESMMLANDTLGFIVIKTLRPGRLSGQGHWVPTMQYVDEPPDQQARAEIWQMQQFLRVLILATEVVKLRKQVADTEVPLTVKKRGRDGD